MVGVAIIPFGALGIPWNALTALAALIVVTAVAACLPKLLARYRDRDGEARADRPIAGVDARGRALG